MRDRNGDWEDGEGTRRLTWLRLNDGENGAGARRGGEGGWGREESVGRDAKIYGDGDASVVFDLDVGGEHTEEPRVGGEAAATRALGVEESLAGWTAAGQQLDHGSTAYREEARTDGSGRDRRGLRFNRSPAELDTAAATSRILTARLDDNPATRAAEASTTAADPSAIDQTAGARLSRRGEAGAQQRERRDDARRAEYEYDAARAEAGEVEGPEFFPLPTLAGQRQQPSTRPCTCARYIGEFGAAPVERGYWFREEKVSGHSPRVTSAVRLILSCWPSFLCLLLEHICNIRMYLTSVVPPMMQV